MTTSNEEVDDRLADKTIYVISTSCLEVPPDGYGGLELMVYNLAHELGLRGYDVSCIAPQGTEIENVDIIPTIEPSDSNECFAREPDAYEEYAQYLPDADIIIDHSWNKMSYIGKSRNADLMSDIPILGVHHGMPAIKEKPPVDNPCYMSVSKSAARAWFEYTGLEVRHAYNGIDFSKYPLGEDKGGYIMTLNRIMPEKGIKECIKLAEYIGERIIIAGEDSFVNNQEYVSEVMGMCARSEYAEYRGTISQEEKVELLQRAKYLVLLPQVPYKEVFGLAAAEAAACGTPTIARRNNGLTEVALNGGHGLAIDGWSDINPNIGMLDYVPSEVRKSAKKSFSKEAMADMYIQRMKEALSDPW